MTSSTQSAAGRFADRYPRTYLWLRGSIGVLLAIGAAWVFFAIAEDLPEKGGLVRADLAIAAWLQTHGTESGESVFWAVSLFGAQILTLVLAAAAVACVRRRAWRHLAVLLITCGGGALLNGALKLSFQRTRPLYAAEFNAASWSFPSGHAMDSLVGYGLLAIWLAERYPNKRALILLGTTVLVGTIGYARVYLGVHYMSDVLAGFSAGALWLLTCVSGHRFLDRRRLASSRSEAT